VGLRSHFVASYYAAPLLITNGRGLIIDTGPYGAVSYYQGPIYGAQKAGAITSSLFIHHLPVYSPTFKEVK
jgi:hypothetical protein